MRAKPYSAYKPSGIAWLGDVPAHWEAKRFGYLFRFFSGGTPATDEAEYWDGRLPWVSAKDMKARVITDTEDHISEAAVSESATCKLPAGSLLLVNRSGILKHSLPVAVLGWEMAINQDIRGCVPRPGVDTKFIAYLIEGNQDALLALWRQQGATVESLNFELTKTTNLQLPPLAEQQAIAAFLDRETGRIDTLVAKKRELIERLQEKRTALISHAVTRGIPSTGSGQASPKAKLKPSGLPWLGDIPAHWKIVPLKRIWAQAEYGISESLSGEGEIRVLTMGNVVDGEVILPSEGCLQQVEERMLLRKGDLLFNRTNSLAHVGKVGILRMSPSAPTTFASYLVRIRTNKLTTPEFANYLLNTSHVLELARSLALPSINQANLNPTRYGQIMIPLPPLDEQRKIVQLLDRESTRLDALMHKAEEAIERLQEYRTALITAAVTGKIDMCPERDRPV